MSLSDAADMAQVVIAAAVGIFTWRLLELERRRVQREVRPVIGLSATRVRDPTVKNFLFSSDLLEMRNYGEAPALGCRVEWRPSDVDVTAGFRTLHDMDHPVGPLSLAASESRTFSLRVALDRALRPDANLTPVMVPNPQFGPQRVGSEMPLGMLRVTFQTIDGEDQGAEFQVGGRYIKETGKLDIICTPPQVRRARLERSL